MRLGPHTRSSMLAQDRADRRVHRNFTISWPGSSRNTPRNRCRRQDRRSFRETMRGHTEESAVSTADFREELRDLLEAGHVLALDPHPRALDGQCEPFSLGRRLDERDEGPPTERHLPPGSGLRPGQHPPAHPFGVCDGAERSATRRACSNRRPPDAGRTSGRWCRTRPSWGRSRRRGEARSSSSAPRPRRSPRSTGTTVDRDGREAGACGQSSARRSAGAASGA